MMCGTPTGQVFHVCHYVGNLTTFDIDFSVDETCRKIEVNFATCFKDEKNPFSHE